MSYGPKRVHSLAWAEGILAIGTSDKQIRLLCERQGKYEQCLSLSGHTNWVTCLQWSPRTDSGERYLASCGPDKTIRLWKFSSSQTPTTGLIELIPKNNCVSLESGQKYYVENEAILYGHEGMVNSCDWAKFNYDEQSVKDFRLISSSADHTLIVWALGASMWHSITHIGDISGLGTVGGHRSFGFYSGIHLERHIISHGSNGSVQFWSKIDEVKFWEPKEPLTGHFKSVEHCSWDRNGRYILTTSVDQTTRAFCPSSSLGWHEIARPQIHGYDLQCISVIDDQTFMSGADEMVLRVFKCPDSFRTRLEALSSGISSIDSLERPAFLPALGLSNKTCAADGTEITSKIVAEMSLNHAPTESDLCRHTLWPEIDKLYGHGYELYSLAVNRQGTLAASSSKANLAADAGIRFWRRLENAEDGGVQWTSAGHIVCHKLTVVDLKFSPDSLHLLATSRDRTWSLIRIKDDGLFELVHRQEGGHSRVIWAGCWLSNLVFATGSRDKYLKLWRLSDISLLETLNFESGVTAVDCSGDGLLAVGEESGLVTMFRMDEGRTKANVLCTIQASYQQSIKDIKWRPGHRQLATVSEDHSFRLHSLV